LPSVRICCDGLDAPVGVGAADGSGVAEGAEVHAARKAEAARIGPRTALRLRLIDGTTPPSRLRFLEMPRIRHRVMGLMDDPGP
jgi:hypothetical protein